MSLLRYQLSRKRRFADRVHTGRGGRIDVDADLTLPSVTGVYALGDFANITAKRRTAASARLCRRTVGQVVSEIPCWKFRESPARRSTIWTKASWLSSDVARALPKWESIDIRCRAQSFAAWLGVHTPLLTSTHAKIEAVMEWAWNYFGGARGDNGSRSRRRNADQLER
jgi:NADH:ubiquinone reductase (H+-translocating)